MHAASVPRLLRGGPDVAGAIVPALARNVPEGVQRLEHGLDDPLFVLRLLGVGFLFEKRPPPKRPSTRSHLAGRHLPISLEGYNQGSKVKIKATSSYIIRVPQNNELSFL